MGRMHLRPALLALGLAGCNQSGLPVDLGAPADQGVAGDDAHPRPWPRRVVLSQWLPDAGGDYAHDNLGLADGVVGATPADLDVFSARSIGLDGGGPATLCEKGTFAALADVPVDPTGCPGSPGNAWQRLALFGATSLHTTEQSASTGTSMLARSAGGGPTYRLRILGDSYQASVLTTVTFDYEPVP
jgi:hypothetical protein